jgi:hypothetical protein
MRDRGPMRARVRCVKVGSRSQSRSLFEHDLLGKPLRTFPDHALFEHDLRANAFRVCREGNRCRLLRIIPYVMLPGMKQRIVRPR